MRESHAYGLKTSISFIEDNFSRLTHKSGRVVLNKLHFISDLLCIISLLLISFQMSTIRSNFKCSKVIGISSHIFGNVLKSSENRWKSSEVARTFLEIPVMTQKNLTRLTQKKLAGIDT